MPPESSVRSSDPPADSVTFSLKFTVTGMVCPTPYEPFAFEEVIDVIVGWVVSTTRFVLLLRLLKNGRDVLAATPVPSMSVAPALRTAEATFRLALLSPGATV